MPQRNSALFAANPTTVTVWGVTSSQKYTYENAALAVVSSSNTSQVFLCAADDVSVAAAPVESFTLAMKLDGLAVTLCNGHGGVCILFDDETTLKAFAQSIADILPAMAQALDFEGTIVDGSEEVYTSDSLLSELSASDFSGIEADEEGFEWEVVDNLTL